MRFRTGFLVVAGAVLLGCSAALRVRIWDALLPETRTRSARIGFFLTLGLHEQAPDARAIKNPVQFCTGFLVVAGVGLEPTTFGL